MEISDVATAFGLFFVLSYTVVHIGGVFHPRNQNMTTVLAMSSVGIPVVLILVLGLIGLIA